MVRSNAKMSRWLLRISRAVLILSVFAAQGAKAEDNGATTDSAERTIDRTQIASAVAFERAASIANGTVLFLAVEVNGMDHGLAQFRLIGNELWASRSVLHDLGLRVDAPAARGEDMISLAAAFGDAVTYNAAAQALNIMVEPRSLAVATSRLNFNTQDNLVAASATGGLLNYDLFANFAGGKVTLDGVTEARVFSGNFLLENTAVFNFGERPGGPDARLWRLDTSVALTFPESRITVRAGDIVTRATSLSRPSRIGGLRIGTDFALQP